MYTRQRCDRLDGGVLPGSEGCPRLGDAPEGIRLGRTGRSPESIDDVFVACGVDRLHRGDDIGVSQARNVLAINELYVFDPMAQRPARLGGFALA